MFRNRFLKIVIICISTITASLFIIECKQAESNSHYVTVEPLLEHSNGKKFMGSKSCAECHSDIYKTHLETAHFKTSYLADITTIKGNLNSGKNSFILNNLFEFSIEATDSGVFERVEMKSNKNLISSSKLDIVIGSGTKGQSYLSWNDNNLNQLQSSYFAPADKWINSPKYPDYLIEKRPVFPRCLECHTTYSKHIPSFSARNSYDKDQMLYGIRCESCHGPSADHVVYHRHNPEATSAKFMIAYKALSQQQRLDACALCHSGERTAKRAHLIFQLETIFLNILRQIIIKLKRKNSMYTVISMDS